MDDNEQQPAKDAPRSENHSNADATEQGGQEVVVSEGVRKILQCAGIQPKILIDANKLRDLESIFEVATILSSLTKDKFSMDQHRTIASAIEDAIRTEKQREHVPSEHEGSSEMLKKNKDLLEQGLQDHVNHHEYVKKFSCHIDNCMNLWRDGKEYYAAYTVLFQSSGTGKTHLLMKTLEERYGVYLCFRSETDKDNYPVRSPVANFVVMGKDKAEALFMDVIEAIQRVFTKWKNTQQNPTPKAWLQYQKGEDPGFDSFGQKIVSMATAISGEKKNVEQQTQFRGTEDKGPFLLCIDEGRELIEKGVFRGVRRCFRNVAGVLGILTDTLSTLTNMAPAAQNDSSSLRLSEKNKLLPPFHLVTTQDVYAGSTTACTDSSYGRPLWHRVEKRDSSLLQKFATNKLLRSTKYNFLQQLEESQRTYAAIACLACRAALSVSPGRRIANELVGGHMAVCVHVYDDREAMVIGYPSEPVLANASAGILTSSGTFEGWEIALQQLVKCVQDGEVDTGKIGELVHRLLLLLTNDRARLDLSNGQNLSAYKFLSTLVGKKKLDDNVSKADQGWLKERTCDFNHFVAVSYLVSYKQLEKLARRKAAVACKPGHNGIDLEIPLTVGGDSAAPSEPNSSCHDSVGRSSSVAVGNMESAPRTKSSEEPKPVESGVFGGKRQGASIAENLEKIAKLQVPDGQEDDGTVRTEFMNAASDDAGGDNSSNDEKPAAVDIDTSSTTSSQRNLACISFQTKNCTAKHHSDFPASATWKLSPQFALNGTDRTHSDCFAIYHNLGHSGTHDPLAISEISQSVHEWKSGDEVKHVTPPKGLKLVGLDLALFESTDSAMNRHLTAIKGLLKTLLDAGRDPLAHLKDADKQGATQMLPSAYAYGE